MPSKSVVCTIIAKNYLPFARVLMSSIRQWNPDVVRVVILADRVDGFFDASKEDFDIILTEDLCLPKARWFHFKYTLLELCTAVKPYAMQHIFDRYGADKVLYFDPDIKVYRALEHLMSMLDRYHIVLTPHLLGPLEDDRQPSELDILRAGVYNLGFLGLAASPDTSQFLAWWKARLYGGCLVDPARGMFVDQRWVDLVPGLFGGVGILRDPGYNVAHWNVNHRRVVKEQSSYTVDGQPLYFFHFSGVDPNNPGQFSRHQNRFRLSDLNDVRPLVEEYCNDLRQHGYDVCSAWPYGYGSFANGVPIAGMARSIHHEWPELIREIEDPFSEKGFRAFVDIWNEPNKIPRSRPANGAVSSLSACQKLNAAGIWLQPGDGSGLSSADLNEMVGDGDAGVRLSRLAQRIYELRPDLQTVFPDVRGRDGVKYLLWLFTFGRREYQLDEVHLFPLRRQWDTILNALNPLRRLWCRMLLLAAEAAIGTSEAYRRLSTSLRRASAALGNRLLYGRSAHVVQHGAAPPAPATGISEAGAQNRSQLG